MKIDLFIFDASKLSEEEIINKFGLSEREVSIFSNIRLEVTKKEKLVSYYMKKKLVGSYREEKNGKPVCDDFYFNISHSQGVVVFAKSDDSPVGVDIEVIRPVDDLLKQYVCNEEEYKYATDYEKFYEIWTAKEAIVKCNGEGLDILPRKIPALPLNGSKIFIYENYFNKVVKENNYVISIAIKGNQDFEINRYNF